MTQPAAQPRLVPAVVGGFKLAANVAYHPGHTWAASEGAQMVRVGIDDFAAKITGHLDKVSLPKPGTWVRQGQAVITIDHDGRQAKMVSPIEGTVMSINAAVAADPELARQDPYGEGWLITVQAPDAKTIFRNLMSGTMVRGWMEDATRRLQSLVPAAAGSRQSPILQVASSLSGATVGQALDRVLPAAHGLRSITVDHGTEFMSRALEDWAYQRGVQLDFLRPGKPVENAFIESFNGRLRD